MFAMHNNTNAPLLKGSANLNWILQILHYYGKKQHKKNRKLAVYWTKCCYLQLPFSLFTATCASFAFLNEGVFKVVDTVLRGIR